MSWQVDASRLYKWWKDPLTDRGDVTAHLLKFADGALTRGEDKAVLDLMSRDAEFAELVDRTLAADVVVEGWLAHEAAAASALTRYREALRRSAPASARRLNEGLVVIRADTGRRPPSLAPIRTPEGIQPRTYVAWPGDAEEASCCRWAQPDGVTVTVYVRRASRDVEVCFQGHTPTGAPPPMALIGEESPSFSPIVEAESADGGRTWTACFLDLAPGEYRVMVPPVEKAAAESEGVVEGGEPDTVEPSSARPNAPWHPVPVWALRDCSLSLSDRSVQRRLPGLWPPPGPALEPGAWDAVLGADIRQSRSSVVPILIPEGVHPVALAAGPGDPDDSSGIELCYPSGIRVTVYASSESRNVRVWIRGLPPTAPPPPVMLTGVGGSLRYTEVLEARPDEDSQGWTVCFRDLEPGEYRVMLPPIGGAAPEALDAGEPEEG